MKDERIYSGDYLRSMTIPAFQACTLSVPQEVTITFHGVVSLHPDGNVTIAEGKTLPDAAMAFWEAVNGAFPGFLSAVNRRER